MKAISFHIFRPGQVPIFPRVAFRAELCSSTWRPWELAPLFPFARSPARIPRADSDPKRGRIDVHHHMLPPFYMDLRRAVPNVGAMPAWSPARSLDDMEKNGVSTVMLSLAVSGVAFDAGEAGRSLARKSNDYGAQLVSDHPESFGLLAALLSPDPQGSLREIEYALDTLHADGIALLSSYGDKWLGDATYAPVFEELNRRKAVIFLHPNAPNCCTNVLPHVPASTIEFLFDTTRTIESLLMNGTFSRYPNLQFIFSHGGGTMPILANRMVRTFPKEFALQWCRMQMLGELKRQCYMTLPAQTSNFAFRVVECRPKFPGCVWKRLSVYFGGRTGKRLNAFRIDRRGRRND